MAFTSLLFTLISLTLAVYIGMDKLKLTQRRRH